MSKESKSFGNDDFRKKPIPNGRLWQALNTTLDVFGPSMKGATIAELQKSGLDPDDSSSGQEHTLDEIGDKLSSIFGTDGTEVIIDQIAKRLKSQEQ